MKLLIAGIITLFCFGASASGYQVERLPWMSVTCTQLQSAILNNDIVTYGRYDYFNTSLAQGNDRHDFCRAIYRSHRKVARSAGPVRTTDRRQIFDLCPLRRVAFECKTTSRGGNR